MKLDIAYLKKSKKFFAKNGVFTKKAIYTISNKSYIDYRGSIYEKMLLLHDMHDLLRSTTIDNHI